MKSYISGLILEMVIISVSNSILLMALGIKYAIFLGIFTGILNIMPFIGIYTGVFFTALVSLTTDASMSQIAWMVVSLLLIHFVDANFLMPRILGAKVKINALIIMLGAVSGGVLFGISGVFLAFPTIAILKILFDRIKGMEAWAILLGDESTYPAKIMIERINKRLINPSRKKHNSVSLYIIRKLNLGDNYINIATIIITHLNVRLQTLHYY